MKSRISSPGSLAAIAAVAAITATLPLAAGPGVAPLPARLGETGLYEPGGQAVRAENIPFTPQYPLWSDGAAKRRWLHLPAGTAVDAGKPDAWEFPPGTRLWKQFGYDRPVETRLIERLPDGSWRYATYVWNEDGTDAVLAPDDGIAALPVRGAPGGRYAIPSRDDCRACHEGPAVPVLGFTALQLADDLPALARRGALRNLPASLLRTPPRIAAPAASGRAALGYLHGNCGHCHNDGALAGVELVLAHEAASPVQSHERALASLLGRPSRYRPQGAKAVQRIVPGDATSSLLVMRMKSHNPAARMPPLGTQVPDAEGIALIERWIQELPNRKETSQ